MEADSYSARYNSQSPPKSIHSNRIEEHEDMTLYLQESQALVNQNYSPSKTKKLINKWLLKMLMRNSELINFPKIKVEYVKKMSALEVRERIFVESYKTDFQRQADLEKGVLFQSDYGYFVQMYDQIKGDHFLDQIQVKQRYDFHMRKSLNLHTLNRIKLSSTREAQEMKESTTNGLSWSGYYPARTRAKAVHEYVSSLSKLKAKKRFPLTGFVMSISDRIYQKNT